MIYDVIIIGSGPAGYTAALYTSREGFSTLIIAGMQPGGQLELTTKVENYPGFPDGIDGPVLMDNMKNQALRFGAQLVNEIVTDIDVSSKPFKVKTELNTYEAKAVIIATGASAKQLGLESEKRLTGRGVSNCATCDGPLYRNKNVIVVGGGDTAMEDALFLTRFANSVTIVHRRDQFRASKIMQDRVLSNPKIKVIWNSVVEDIKGSNRVESVVLRNLVTNETQEIKIDGVFIAIGHQPNTDFLKGKIKLDEQGYIITKDEVKTDIDGLFAAGDVVDRVYKQAVTAAGSGAKAALEVRSYLQNRYK
ncbi:MAG: thioredoxin reductase [Candidatus Micrarchaeota archaeon]|nr:MAG: thioredoxin reductase [Candidatus Micrarchaeota archaeon]